MQKSDSHRVRPEQPHFPLVLMTVLTQLSVGTFVTIWIDELFGRASHLSLAAMVSVVVGALALGASAMHLGRPIYAYRDLKMWRHSWLSREVLMFSCFSVVAGLYAVSLWLRLPGSMVLGLLTSLVGLCGVTASACIYLVRARPAWNSKHTIAEFHLTGGLLGPLFIASLGVGDRRWMVAAAVAAAGAQLLNQAIRFFWMIASDSFELQASARLLSTTLAFDFVFRSALLIIGGIVLPLLWPTPFVTCISLALALGGEILGRYLFFVSVVPKNMAAPYPSVGKAAA